MRVTFLSAMAVLSLANSSWADAYKPSCGDPKVVSFIETSLQKTTPHGVLAATANIAQSQRKFFDRDQAYGQRESMCQSKMGTEINRWFTSIGHPENRVSDYDVREMNLCSLPIELTHVEAQCRVVEDRLIEEYRACKQPAINEMGKLDDDRERALGKARYKLTDIRTAVRDPNTGTVGCVANLHTSLPSPYGTLRQAIKYKVEATSDNRPYTSVYE